MSTQPRVVGPYEGEAAAIGANGEQLTISRTPDGVTLGGCLITNPADVDRISDILWNMAHDNEWPTRTRTLRSP